MIDRLSRLDPFAKRLSGWLKTETAKLHKQWRTGKTHIATALAVQTIEHRRRKACFFATVDLVNVFKYEKAINKAGQLAERLLRLGAEHS